MSRECASSFKWNDSVAGASFSRSPIDPGGKTVRRVPDQQAKDREPMLLGQGAECGQCSFCFHISNNIEL